MPSSMTKLHQDFICAHSEIIQHRMELMAQLSQMLNIHVDDLFYQWVLPPRGTRFKPTGMLSKSDWQYSFRSHQCVLQNLVDKRCLQIDFGPGGRYDIISGQAVMRYVLTATSPWREFSALRVYLADGAQTSTGDLGSSRKLVQLLDSIDQAGLIELAAPHLHEIVEQYTKTDPMGRMGNAMPSEYSNPQTRIYWDIAVSNRKILSAQGEALVRAEC